jgi:hypothetical protein
VKSVWESECETDQWLNCGLSPPRGFMRQIRGNLWHKEHLTHLRQRGRRHLSVDPATWRRIEDGVWKQSDHDSAMRGSSSFEGGRETVFR